MSTDHVAGSHTPPVAGNVADPQGVTISNNTPTTLSKADAAAIPVLTGASNTDYEPHPPHLSQRALKPTTIAAETTNMYNLRAERKSQQTEVSKEEKACSTRLRTQIIYGSIIALTVVGLGAAIAAALFFSPVGAIFVGGIGLIAGGPLVAWASYGLVKAMDANPMDLARAQSRLQMINQALKRLEDTKEDDYSFEDFLEKNFHYENSPYSGASIDDMPTYMALYDEKLRLLKDEKDVKELEKENPKLEQQIQDLEDKIADLKTEIKADTLKTLAEHLDERTALINKRTEYQSKLDAIPEQKKSTNTWEELGEIEEEEKALREALDKIDKSQERIEELDTLIESNPQTRIDNLTKDIANLQSQIDLNKKRKDDLKNGQDLLAKKIQGQKDKQYRHFYPDTPPAAQANPSNVQAQPVIPAAPGASAAPAAALTAPPIPSTPPPPPPGSPDQPQTSTRQRKPLPPPPASKPPTDTPPSPPSFDAIKPQPPAKPPRKPPPPDTPYPGSTPSNAAANNTTPIVTTTTTTTTTTVPPRPKTPPALPPRPTKNQQQPPSDTK